MGPFKGHSELVSPSHSRQMDAASSLALTTRRSECGMPRRVRWSQDLSMATVARQFRRILARWKRIVSGSDDRTIRVWDAETGEDVMGPLKGHSGSVTSVAFSPDGRRIVSGSDDTTIRVHDAMIGGSKVRIFSALSNTRPSLIISSSRHLVKCRASFTDSSIHERWLDIGLKFRASILGSTAHSEWALAAWKRAVYW